jgi:hypothetical protein
MRAAFIRALSPGKFCGWRFPAHPPAIRPAVMDCTAQPPTSAAGNRQCFGLLRTQAGHWSWAKLGVPTLLGPEITSPAASGPQGQWARWSAPMASPRGRDRRIDGGERNRRRAFLPASAPRRPALSRPAAASERDAPSCVFAVGGRGDLTGDGCHLRPLDGRRVPRGGRAGTATRGVRCFFAADFAAGEREAPARWGIGKTIFVLPGEPGRREWLRPTVAYRNLRAALAVRR